MINKTNIKQCRYLKLLAIISLSALQIVGLNRNHALAQSSIVPDETLGNEKSQVVPFNGSNAIGIIQGGAVRGSNLFHSFIEFNIDADKGAYFFSPNAEIQNILARVTGRNPSEILGILGTRVFDGSTLTGSNANLFLINPNGIVFGENARLDVGGSFVATTADGIQFGEQGVFSAINPGVPQILNINPSAFLFNQIAAQPIVNKSRVANSISTSITDGLRVPDGKNLLLLGGDITLDGGFLNAVGGKIELGGLATPETVNLNVDGNNLDVTFPDNVEYSDITLQNQAFINTSGVGGGEIQIQGNNVTVKDNSNIFSFTNGDCNDQGININATQLDILGTSNIQTGATSTGNSGNISIKTRNLNVLNGGQISASSFNQGAGGSLEIDADTVEIIGVSTDRLFSSTLFTETSGVDSSAKAGNITLNSRTLNIRDGGIISTQTFNQGNSGNLTLTARESLNISGAGTLANGYVNRSGLFTSTNSSGTAGNIKIFDTGTIKIEDGGAILASTFNQGSGGNIEIHADILELIGVSTKEQLPSTLVTETSGENSSAKAGDVTLNSRILNLRDGAVISTQTFNQGKGGNLTLTARESLNINGNATLPNNQFFVSALSTSTQASGTAGNLKIVDTGTIKVENGGQVFASSFNRGDGGNIEINADIIELIGVSINKQFRSGLFSETSGVDSSAKAGSVTLSSRILNLRDGGAISTQTFNQGKGGNLTVTARESLNISGISPSSLPKPNNPFFRSALVTTTAGSGSAGNIKIFDTGIIKIDDGGVISASSLNQGDGGNIEINADALEIIGVSPNGEFRNGLFSLNSGVDSFSTAGNGVFSITAGVDSSAKAGDITLNTRNLNLRDGAVLSTQSTNEGEAGNITIQNDGRLQLTGSSILTNSSESSGGSINITAKDIRLFENSGIRTDVNNGTASGGNITLTANTIIALDNSDILSFSADGKGGDINFNTAAFFSNPLYKPTPPIRDRQALNQLNTNEQVDVNASGTVSGTIAGIPDTTFIQDSLTELPENQIDTNVLVASSCIVRNNQQNGTFFVTGAGGLPQNPSDAPLSNYSTGKVQSIPSSATQIWKIGDPIVEPSGAYQLPNGQILLSRECSK